MKFLQKRKVGRLRDAFIARFISPLQCHKTFVASRQDGTRRLNHIHDIGPTLHGAEYLRKLQSTIAIIHYLNPAKLPTMPKRASIYILWREMIFFIEQRIIFDADIARPENPRQYRASLYRNDCANAR